MLWSNVCMFELTTIIIAFPLFGHRLFDALGIDWGVGLLAFLTLGLGVPFLPIVGRIALVTDSTNGSTGLSFWSSLERNGQEEPGKMGGLITGAATLHISTKLPG